MENTFNTLSKFCDFWLHSCSNCGILVCEFKYSKSFVRVVIKKFQDVKKIFGMRIIFAHDVNQSFKT